MKPILFHISLSVPTTRVDSFVNLLENISENVSWDVSDSPEQEIRIDAFVSNKDSPTLLTQKSVAETLSHAIKNYELPQPSSLSIEEVPEKNWLLENQLSFPPLDIGSFLSMGLIFRKVFPLIN